MLECQHHPDRDWPSHWQAASSRKARKGGQPLERVPTCSTSSEKSFGCGEVKRMRISGSTPAAASSSSAKAAAPSRRGLYTLWKQVGVGWAW